MKNQNHFLLKKTAGFTLAELLVVIAVISLLSSIIVVAARGAREKAEFAKVFGYSANIKHALGAYIVGEWRFEEGSDNTVGDNSGLGNNGTWDGAAGWKSGGVDPKLGTAGQFFGTNFVTIPSSNSLNIKNVITIEAWMKPTQDVSTAGIVNKNYSYQFWVLSGRAIFDVFITSPVSTSCGRLQISYSFKANQWYHYVATWDGSKSRIFVNAKEIGSSNFTCTPKDLRQVTDPVNIGAMWRSGSILRYPFRGFIDEVRIYQESLSQAQIQRLYVEGAEKRGLLAEE